MRACCPLRRRDLHKAIYWARGRNMRMSSSIKRGIYKRTVRQIKRWTNPVVGQFEFVGAKEKNCSVEMKAKGAGDVWTWTAIDAESKLIPYWFVGQRDAGCAYHFMHDL